VQKKAMDGNGCKFAEKDFLTTYRPNHQFEFTFFFALLLLFLFPRLFNDR
jgi:hypothetical protein